MLAWENYDNVSIDTLLDPGIYIIKLEDAYGQIEVVAARFCDKTGWWFDTAIDERYDMIQYAKLDELLSKIPT